MKDIIKIELASPADILKWSRGEVKTPETINYKNQKAKIDGLFSEAIFGPVKDYKCQCGKLSGKNNQGLVCTNPKCRVEVTSSRVRRVRMGHIHLETPVAHIWYFKATSIASTLLGISSKNLQDVLYFQKYVVIDPGVSTLDSNEILSESAYRSAIKTYPSVVAMMGAEAVEILLKRINLAEEIAIEEESVANGGSSKAKKSERRLKVLRSFLESGVKPEWMILRDIPVIPPDLRPMIQLDDGHFGTSDINDLYRRLIIRNKRLKHLMDLQAPEVTLRNEQRMIQDAADAIFFNSKKNKPFVGPAKHEMKSLTEGLVGKKGLFRSNLLGKRVDFSARSVIVAGPELEINQCGLPREIALELFKPFIAHRLLLEGRAANSRQAMERIERGTDDVYHILEEVAPKHPVLLNRAPTLHKLSIQSFYPVIISGRAIRLHPLVCQAFNADFDGDQMAVHLPLSVEAQAEARELMMSNKNIMSPKDGRPTAMPTKDMVLGIYMVTQEKDGAEGEGRVFSSPKEAVSEHARGKINIRSRIFVQVSGKKFPHPGIIQTSVGRILFNDLLPEEVPYISDDYPSDIERRYLVDKTPEEFLRSVPTQKDGVSKKQLEQILNFCIEKTDQSKMPTVLDGLKRFGFHYATTIGASISMSDLYTPETKQAILAEAEKNVLGVIKSHSRGLVTDSEMDERIISIWEKVKDKISAEVASGFDAYNPLRVMAFSGARGTMNQLVQITGMRGLMANASGETISVPVKSSFKDGLSVLEYFISTHGARKGLADTALRTADSGYLTRRLVDVAHGVIVNTDDCGVKNGEVMKDLMDVNAVIVPLRDRIYGRVLSKDIGGFKAGTIVDKQMAEDLASFGAVEVFTPLTCLIEDGICQKCYGADLSAPGGLVAKGTAVGVIAAQSIGEPGTQLTMRNFHTGGVASGLDITQGLPRIEDLFEAKRPAAPALISEIDGIFSINGDDITIDGEEVIHLSLPYGQRATVKAGDMVHRGEILTSGYVDPRELASIMGIRRAQEYIITEAQKEYRRQGVEIHDKHFEIITRRMVSENELVSITRAALQTESFLSAASFQETHKVLAEASIAGAEDRLKGLKENVIVGNLIPAGTGFTGGAQ